MTKDDNAERDKQSSERPPRKAYQKPRLERYGDLAEMANSQNAGTKNDGSGHPNKHFTS